MRIAVIIPVYNVTQFLDAAIRSVVSQKDSSQEIIVVDDGSAAEHASIITEICNRYPTVKCYHQPHGGAAAARDFGRAQTDAECIVFLDADDVLLPSAFAIFTEAMQRAPDAVAVYARVENIDEAGNVISGMLPAQSWIASGAELLEFLLQRKVSFCNGSVCIRAAALRAISVNNHHLTIGEDWVLWCHLALFGNIIYADEHIVLHRRKHPQNISLRSLDDPALLMDALRTIFAHPAFEEKMGAEKLRGLHEKALCRIHAYLASVYAANAQPEKAAIHLQQITLPLSEIRD